MFIDQVTIRIQAGDGGDGCVSFHREKYVPRGGPDGGDGGHGGNLVFVAKNTLRTLIDYRYKKLYKAGIGMGGSGNNMRGKDGADLVLEVPPGTVVRDAQSGRVVADLFHVNQPQVVLHGGRGGRGNARFATPTRQAPRFAQMGQRVGVYEVILELKTIADVGLVGFPNVGKSTLLSVVSKARPKIANYHFTTLQPNLGVVSVGEDSFVMADIPGLIEGAHEGAGLGQDFLRHVERTRMLVHVVDISASEGRDPVEDYHKINEELSRYSEVLASLQQIVVANKMDLSVPQENIDRLRAALPDGTKFFAISAVTREGVEPFLYAIAKVLQTLPAPQPMEREMEIEDLEQPEGFTIERDGEDFVVDGPLAHRLLYETYLDDPQSMKYFQQRLVQTGIIDALREAGATQGDTVLMQGIAFDFVE